MPALANKKHEDFARRVAMLGDTYANAYRLCVAGPDAIYSTSLQRGCELASTAKVAARIAELREKNAESIERILGVKRDALLRYLVEVLETPPSEVTRESRIAQSVEVDADGRERVKMFPKHEAVKMIAAMAGLNAPERHSVAIGVAGKEEERRALDAIFGVGLIDPAPPVAALTDEADAADEDA